MVGVLTRWWKAMGSGDGLRFGRRGTFRGRFVMHRPDLELNLKKFGDGGRYVLAAFGLWVYLWRSRHPVPADHMMQHWGLTRTPRGVAVEWSTRRVRFDWPWALEFVRREHLMRDFRFAEVEWTTRWPKWLRVVRRRLFDLPRRPRRVYGTMVSEQAAPFGPPADAWEAARYRETVPFRYVTDRGVIQDTTATVTVERVTWCWQAFWLLGLWVGKRTATTAWCEFATDIGEGVGEWKGGVIGAGVDIRDGETPVCAVRRMEAERRFGR